MVILRSQYKITDFLMILSWVWAFKDVSRCSRDTPSPCNTPSSVCFLNTPMLVMFKFCTSEENLSNGQLEAMEYFGLNLILSVCEHARLENKTYNNVL